LSHGKLYRSFIILQEDERGHSVSSDKPLSGYAKIEAKNDKCKITFYAQNLKKDNGKLCMILICSKKDNKQLINLGLVNISEQGKAETSCEYLANDVGGSGILFDKVSGAALAKEMDGKLTFVLGGFMNGETPSDDWKAYKLTNAKIKTEMKVEEKVEVKESSKDEHKKLEYEQDKKVKVEIKEKVEKKREEELQQSVEEEVKDNPRKPEESPQEGKIVVEQADKNLGVDEEINRAKVETPSNIVEDESVEGYLDKINDREEEDPKDHKFEEYERSIVDVNERDEDLENSFEIRGSIGEFFQGVVQDFEEVGGFRDIKYCKWYKVPVKDLDVMCNISNYNKYTVVYYPMINYYPYIKKYGYFMVGFKCDDEGRVKYLVYAVPGTKDKLEQPYGGKSGFVTWMPYSKQGKDYGYWLMFYDFKNSMIVVPMK
jgi:hypothetical protein